MASLEMLSGRSNKEHATEVQSDADAPEASDEPTPITSAQGAESESDFEAVVAMWAAGRLPLAPLPGIR